MKQSFQNYLFIALIISFQSIFSSEIPLSLHGVGSDERIEISIEEIGDVEYIDDHLYYNVDSLKRAVIEKTYPKNQRNNADVVFRYKGQDVIENKDKFLLKKVLVTLDSMLYICLEKLNAYDTSSYQTIHSLK